MTGQHSTVLLHNLYHVQRPLGSQDAAAVVSPAAAIVAVWSAHNTSLGKTTSAFDPGNVALRRDRALLEQVDGARDKLRELFAMASRIVLSNSLEG